MVARTRVRVSAERVRVWRELVRTQVAVSRAIEEELARAGTVPLAWYDVLACLDEAGGRRRMQDLAERVAFSRSGATRLVDRMVAAGLVRRAPCTDDGRGTWAVLTTAGKRRLRDTAGVHLQAVRDHFTRHLTEHDVRSLHDGLRRVLDAEGLHGE